jgi:hypothetical protein
MFDQFIGLLLFGLGIHVKPAPNLNIKGEATTAAQQTDSSFGNNTFRLNPKNFEVQPLNTASGPGIKRPEFDSHAFGKEILRVQQDFVIRLEASRAAANKELVVYKNEFRQKLAIIKDAKKQVIAERISTNCQNINLKRTDKMTGMLAKLSTILTNVSDRAASAAAEGKDTTGVENAVTTAQTAIADAQVSVAAQAGKICTITLTTETNLKTDVGKTISSLEADLKSVYEKVIEARKAVGDALRALSGVIGEPLAPVITPPAHASPSGNEPG